VIYLKTIVMQLPCHPAIAIAVKIYADGLYAVQDIHVCLLFFRIRLLGLVIEAANVSKADKAPDIKRVIRYISSNASGLKDYREHADQHDNNLRRTGSIEGNVDKLIVRRMKNQGMSWTRQGIRRMLWLRIKLREGKLADYLPAHKKEITTFHVASIKRINRVMERTLKHDYINYFSAGLPALSGPHASRPWAEMLKSLSGLAS
jgi:hypothetical protein